LTEYLHCPEFISISKKPVARTSAATAGFTDSSGRASATTSLAQGLTARGLADGRSRSGFARGANRASPRRRALLTKPAITLRLTPSSRPIADSGRA
jgi:hypothetical protein